MYMLFCLKNKLDGIQLCIYILHIIVKMLNCFNLIVKIGDGLVFLGCVLYLSYILPLFVCGLQLLQIPNSCWNMVVYLFICSIDLRLKQKYIGDNPIPFIKNGAILTNHRSFTDLFLDKYLTQGTVIARKMVLFVIGIMGLFSVFEDRTIFINRKKDDRNTIWKKMEKHKLILFYPEGTRCSHLTLPVDYREIEMRFGLLKSVYENGLEVQVYISAGKEDVVNEKKLRMGFGKTVVYMVGEPLQSKEYDTFEKFIDAVKLEWHTLWNHVYSSSHESPQQQQQQQQLQICDVAIPFYG